MTWGAEQLLPAGPWPLPNACYGIAAWDTTHVAVNSALYTGFDVAGSLIYQSVYSAGAWGAWSNTGPSNPAWGQLRGLQAMTLGSGQAYYAAGVQMRGLKTGCAVGFTTQDTGTLAWTDWLSIAPMDNKNLGLAYQYPSISNTGNGYFYVAALLNDDGSVSGSAQTRTAIVRSGYGVTWPYQLLGWIGNVLTTNACALQIGSTVYAFDAKSVYTSSAPSTTLDVSNDVLSLHVAERDGEPASAVLVLSNAAGQYTSHAALTPNTTITIALGYNGATVTTHTLYADSMALIGTGNSATCEISGRSVSKLLDQVVQRATIYANQSLGTLVTDVCTQAGVPLAGLPATSQFSQTVPCFMLQPGDTWLVALNRLGNLYGFDRLDMAAPSVKIVERAAGDSSSWSYGQEHLGIAWAHHSDQSTLIRVIGASTTSTPVFADITDDTAILLSGGERYRHIVERMLTSSAQCRLRAQLEMNCTIKFCFDSGADSDSPRGRVGAPRCNPI